MIEEGFCVCTLATVSASGFELPSICLGLNIRSRFKREKMQDSYGHENKISNTAIINNDVVSDTLFS